MAEETQHDLPTLVSSLQAATVEWSLPAQRVTNSSMTGSSISSGGGMVGVRVGGRYLRYAQVLQDIDKLFADVRVGSSAALVAWCASLQQSSVAGHFGALIVDHVLQGMLPYVALQQCLRLLDTFLGWVTRPNAGSAELGIGAASPSCPVLVPSHVVVEWIELTWSTATTLSRDNAGTSSPMSTASLCGALQLLPILLRWNLAGSPLPPFRRAQLPHPANMLSLEARLLALQVLPPLLQHQPGALGIQACTYEMIEYIKRACTKAAELSVRIAAGTSLRGLLEAGLRVSSPTVAYSLMDMLLTLCDEASLQNVADEELYDVGVAMGYLLAFYQCDFTMDVLADVLQASAASTSKPAGEERSGYRSVGGGGSGSGRVRWQFFGGSDAVEGSRVVQRSFNERMSRPAQRALATALATLCSCCATPATTADAIQCCFVLLVPLAGDARAYMPRLLADAMLEWATQLPSNGYRVMLADALRGYIQRSSEDKTVARTAMVALQGVMLTLTSSLEIGFNVAEDVLAAVQATPSLLHAGVEVLGAVARTNVLYARHLQHQCARVDSADVANTLAFQLHVRALLDAASVLRAGPASQEDTLGEEDRVSLVHVCIRLLLRLSRGDPPRTVQNVHYRQAELIFRLTQLLYDLLRGSTKAVLGAIRDEVLPCTVGFMNLLVGSPAPTIAYYKAVAAACAMLRRAPVISDMECMLAVGFLEAHRASQTNAAEQDSSAATSSAATAYFAISRGSLFKLISSKPWITCKDDGSLRWLAAQALKDVATACAQGVPVLSFADACDAAVASAAQSMRLLRSDFLPNPASETSFGASSAAAETPTHTVEECGGHAVRLLRWTLRHFLQRAGADGVCVALLTSLRTELLEVCCTPVGAGAAESTEDGARRALQQDVALWNCLCIVEQFLREASPRMAAALWQNADWDAEVKRWQSLAAQLVPAVARASVEVRLLAARVLGHCLVSTGQVDLYTSQTMSAATQGFVGKSVQYDALSALMVLSEAHSCYKECRAATAVATSTDNDSSPTLPLATSLLVEAWKQITSSAPTANTAAVMSAPLLLLLSLRLTRAYPAEVEAALFDSVMAALLAPMTAGNRFWWSPASALSVLTAVQQLWTAFPGNMAGASAVRHATALALLQQSHAAALRGQRASSSTVVAAALDAVHIYTLKQQREGGQAALPGTREQHDLWYALLHQCLDHVTFIPPDEVNTAFRANMRVRGQSTALRRRVMLDDDVSRRLAVLWRMAIEGVTEVSPSAARGNVRLLNPVDVAVQVDVAIAAATRREWVSVAQSMYTLLLSQRSTWAPLEAGGADSPLKMYLDGIRAVLQARSPHVQVDVAKRGTDMFAAVEVAGAADTVRGGGSDSEDAKEYAEEYGEEDMGGILSEAGEASRGGGTGDERGSMAFDLGAGGGHSAAASLTFDVAAKEAAMWLLYGVLHSISVSSSSSTTTGRENDDEARRALLPVVVAAAQLVEVHPEVQMSTIAVLHEVLVAWGNATQQQGYSRETPVLLQWKTQLVVGLTTVLQHGLLSLEGCTSLAVQYSRCNMADPSSCRRVLRSLLLLLHACHRLHDRGRGFLLIGSSGAGHVIVALAKVSQASAMHPEGGDVGGSASDGAAAEQSQRNILRSLTSAPCQAALTLLCELFVTAASLANGYVQSADTIGLGWSDGGEEDDGTSVTSSVYASRTSVSAGDVLQAVAFLTQEPLKAVLGPALRYASGCLAVLVLSTLSLSATPPPPPDGSPSSSMTALTSMVALSGQLAANHQRLLAQLAQERLCARIEKCLSSSQPLQSEWDAVDTGLLRIVTVAPVSRDTAAALLERITPVLSQPAASGWKAEVAASILLVGMTASLDMNRLLPLLTALSVESLLSDVPQEVLARLHQAVRSYLRKGGSTRARALALASPAGLLLAEHCATSDDSSVVCHSPLTHRAAWPVVQQLLWEARDPLHVVTVMWSSTPSPAHATSSCSAPLREQVPQHRLQAEILLAILASLGTSSASHTDVSEAVVPLLLRCGHLMSELLVGIMASAEEHAATPDSDALHTVLAYVVAVLCTPPSAAFAVALRPVGLHLVRTVAPSAGPALREAIQRLGPTKAMQLRSFMEGSCA
ncbi:conserved hypothetical protein [Leishmania mexicana MHOM/GT/2001/U1103]|uniref:Uncharacterized protein n=1 Tax=Leishmania mexicana (strain MHOM/GT/2001/U1103) TaxID=929439 RepID=E9AUU0_LEIMU|nr:conserved hypothetical protein [Leishmania mexicana MHOM/GT/2001/U1103]CBZ26721.1 conserved hypothetical protein [Leishmania mexicana MHOM/GT/2001/U1103]